jgi:O-antigen ligase
MRNGRARRGNEGLNGRIAGLAGLMPGYRTLNPLSTALSFALPATLGSGISVAYHACAAWCIFEVLLRSGFSADRLMWAASFCLTLYAGLSFAAFWINGVGDDYGALIPLLTLVTLPFTYSVLTISRKADTALAATAGSMLAAYAAGAAALAEFLAEGKRSEGLAGNALVFAHVSALAGSVCLIGLLLGFDRWRGRSLRPWLFGALLAAAAAVILSGSRGYWGVVLAQGALLLAFGRAGIRFRPTLRGAAVGALAAALLALLAYRPFLSRLRALNRDLVRLGRENYDTSVGLRLRLFELGTDYVREHPWIGRGVPSLHPLVQRGLSERYGLDASFSHFHNGFVTAAVETGLPGLAALLCLLGILLYAAVRALRGAGEPAERFGGLMLLALVVATAGGGLFNILIGHDILDATLMVWIMVGLFLACGAARPEPGRTGIAG